MEELTLYADGGARGNPGPAGIGVVIERSGKVIKEISEPLPAMTNNQAEYRALTRGLEEVIKISRGAGIGVRVYLDSELLVEQLNLRYRVKNKDLQELFWKVRAQVSKLGGRVVFSHVPRGKNARADKLVNLAIDRA
jgi:ribonuclease HI